jgi:hypothetical protein
LADFQKATTTVALSKFNGTAHSDDFCESRHGGGMTDPLWSKQNGRSILFNDSNFLSGE